MPWLYRVYFILEINAKTLLYQLNLPTVDLPGALITRWIAWIRLFDFEVRHVAGKQHGGPDGLSRKPQVESDIAPEEEDYVDDYIAERLDTLSVSHEQ